jgi:hypothetical protein
LGVNQQGETTGTGDQNTVVDAETVRGQPLHGPIACR